MPKIKVSTEFICHLTGQIMAEPAMAADGFFYERRAIKEWIKTRRVSPINGKTLADLEIRDNPKTIELETKIAEFKTKNNPCALETFLAACATNNRDTVEALTYLDTYLDAKDSKGDVPLIAAIKRSAHIPRSAAAIVVVAATEGKDIAASSAPRVKPPAEEKVLPPMVEFLLTAGANPESPDASGNVALHIAISLDLPLIIERLINAGVDVGAQNTITLETPLIKAAKRGYIDTVDYLLAHNAPLYDRDKRQLTALMWACRRGHEGVITLLREAERLGISIDKRALSSFAPNPHLISKSPAAEAKQEAIAGRTPPIAYDIAGKNKERYICAVLIDSGFAPAETARIQFDSYLLHQAAYGGHVSVMEQLLSAGDNPNAPDEKGNTPLIIAAGRGHVGAVERLLKTKADTTLKNTRGQTALMAAVNANKPQVVAELLAIATPAPSAFSSTPIPRTSEGAHSEAKMAGVAIVAIDDKKMIDLQNSDGDTALNIACRLGHRASLDPLLMRGASLTLANNTGATPLTSALSASHFEIAEQLLARASALLEASNLEGETPLMWAARHGKLTVVNFLLAHRANVRNKGGEDMTALRWALRNNHVEIVKRLLMQYVGETNTATQWDEKQAPSDLNLTACSLNDDDLIRLVPILKSNRFLRHLNLSRNALGQRSGIALAEFINNNIYLETLNLSHNPLGVSGLFSSSAISVATATLKDNLILKTLMIRNIQLTQSDANNLLTTAERHHQLRTIDMDDNPKITAAQKHINQQLRLKRTFMLAPEEKAAPIDKKDSKDVQAEIPLDDVVALQKLVVALRKEISTLREENAALKREKEADSKAKTSVADPTGEAARHRLSDQILLLRKQIKALQVENAGLKTMPRSASYSVGFSSRATVGRAPEASHAASSSSSAHVLAGKVSAGLSLVPS
ncbi:hypothetical protein BH10PSE19_BH10PSE19_00290 [soil metagenome]